VLILAGALIVARPLVPGDDPGLLEPTASVSGLLLNGLWLIAALGWAVWKLWTGANAWRAGLVELMLFVFAMLLFVAAGATASFKRPALFTAWDALFLLLVFSLVRDLAAEPGLRRGLLSLVAATAVCVAVFGLYQFTIDLPRVRDLGAHPDLVRLSLIERFDVHLAEDSPRLAAIARRLANTPLFSTFESPSSLACYLTLTLPLLLVVAASSVTHAQARFLIAPSLLFVVAIGVVLWLTDHIESWWALLIGVGLAALVGWQTLTGRTQRGVIVAVVILGAVGVGSLGILESPWGSRVEGWTNAVNLMSQHPWLGVGPANFSRHFAPSFSFIDWRMSQGPRNFLLEAALSGGVVAGLIFLAAIGVWCWRTVKSLPGAESEQGGGLPWECYLSGMVGLLLAFLLRAISLPQSEILGEGIAALVRAGVWFAAFGLSYAVLRDGALVRLGLLAGATACLLMMLMNDGLLSPALAQPLWIAAALAMTASPGSARPASLLATVAVLVVVGIFYLMTVQPALAAAQALNRVRLVRPLFQASWSRDKGNPAKTTLNLLQDIRDNLDAAVKADPLNPTPLLRQADWSRELGMLTQGEAYGPEALKRLDTARELDPLNTEILAAEFVVRVQFARLCHTLKTKRPAEEKALTADADQHLFEAERLLRELSERDPAEASWMHRRLAEVYTLMKNDAQARIHTEAGKP
jgi:hypothetical protein